MLQTNLPSNSPIATPPRPEIFDVLKAHHGERHLVVLQAYPDPDAIASGFAHRLISAQFDIETTLTYTGKISHRQNAALVKLLGIELRLYDPSMAMSDFAGAVFVDNQGTTSEEIVRAFEAAGVPALIVVDHHDVQDRLKPEFSDIRRVGATATLYANYLEHGPLMLSKSQREHVLVATALLHGLITDTGGFVQADAQDFCAARYLSQYRDAELLGQIMHQARSKQTMDVIRQALGNRVVAESFSIAGIGYLRAEDRDAIPQAADFLLTEENVHTAIVYGIVTLDDRSETVVGSMRTSRLTLAPDSFLKEVFGRKPDGRPYGGGKASAGGFDIPVGFLSAGRDDDYQKLKWQLYNEQIRHKLLDKIGVEHKQSE